MFPLNVPNFLTVLRILLVPVIVVALLAETPNGDTLAAVVFAFAAFTDGLDGYIARSRGSVTTFGKLMDPIADKLLIIAPLILLVSSDRIAAWVAMVIIAREFAVTGLANGGRRAGHRDPGRPARQAEDHHPGGRDLRLDRRAVDARSGWTRSSTSRSS